MAVKVIRLNILLLQAAQVAVVEMLAVAVVQVDIFLRALPFLH